MDIQDKTQLEKAKLEDVLMELLYTEYPDLVFHGGTAIWRCYNGNRFSRDLDFYFRHADGTNPIDLFTKFFKESGFSIKSRSHNRTTNTMQFLVEGNTKMKVDINLNYKKGSPVEYTRTDDSRMIVSALTPAELLGEKIDAYLDKLHSKDGIREPEAQDLYDIYFLTGVIGKGTAGLRGRLKELMDEIGDKPPANMGSLDHLIIRGIAPTFELMVKSIKGWIG